MKLSKPRAYFFFLSVLVSICLLYQAVWLFSGITTGEILDFGKGSGHDFKHVENVAVRYVVGDKEYTDIYLRNELDGSLKTVSIKYLLFAPAISRMDTLVGNWGLVLVVFIIVLFCLSISFLIPQIVPKGPTFILAWKFPFVRLMKVNITSN